MSEVAIHPSAVVDPRAQLGARVRIGPFAVVSAEVELGDDSRVHSHAVLTGPARFGARTEVYPFAVLGGPGQRRAGVAHEGLREGRLWAGDDNVFREHVTVHRGSYGDTLIGARCLLMAGSHAAHDVVLGDDVVLANAVQLAGHVVVGDFAVFGGLAAVAQRVRIGESAFVAGGAMVERDVPPLVIVQGDRARVRAVNQVGLRRRGLSVEERRAIERAYRQLYVRGERSVPELDEAAHPLLRAFVEFHRRERAAAE